MAQEFTNNASGLLDVGISASDTSLSLGSGQGALFPQVNGADPDEFAVLTIQNQVGQFEIVKSGQRSGDIFLIERGYEDTTALDWSAGVRVEIRVTAGIINRMVQTNDDGKVAKTIDMGDKRITNLAPATANTDAVNKNQLDIVAGGFGDVRSAIARMGTGIVASSGSGLVWAAGFTTPFTALEDGIRCLVRAHQTITESTDSITLNIDALGARSLYRADAASLQGAIRPYDINDGDIMDIAYDEGNDVWQLLNPKSGTIASDQNTYPVGAIYLTKTNENPSTFIAGTTWVAFAQGRVLSGVGSFVDLSGKGGSLPEGDSPAGRWEHTITEAQMPEHDHAVTPKVGGAESGNGYPTGWNDTFGSRETKTTTKAGGGAAINITQPSYGVYVWYRVS
tara:strand:- start:1650 stop:2834 length:1185 start_codon:yes stop_codon:yes gene_type:complete